MHKILFTQKGFENLKQELSNEISKRPEAVKSLQRGREMGDLSENGLYKAARMELSNIDRQIRYLKNLVKYAKVIEPENNKFIQIGHTILIESEKGKREFLITGEYEANPKENKISYKSPLGNKLLGKQINDNALIQTPNGNTNYKVINISKN